MVITKHFVNILCTYYGITPVTMIAQVKVKKKKKMLPIIVYATCILHFHMYILMNSKAVSFEIAIVINVN